MLSLFLEMNDAHWHFKGSEKSCSNEAGLILVSPDPPLKTSPANPFQCITLLVPRYSKLGPRTSSIGTPENLLECRLSGLTPKLLNRVRIPTSSWADPRAPERLRGLLPMEHALGNIVQGGWGLGSDSGKQLVREKGVWPDRDRPLAGMGPSG